MLQHFHDFAIDTKVPCRIVHGTKDLLVAEDSIERYMRVNNYSRLCKNKQMHEEAEAVLWTIEGVGHHLFASKYSEEIMERMSKFFEELDQTYVEKWKKEMQK